MNQNKKCIILLGPTASGKTAFGVKLAERIQGEIISVDSRQVYRGLDLGSGKDLEEYTLPSGKTIPSHLLDIADPAVQDYSLADFLQDSNTAVEQILQRQSVPLFVGGTALYLHALLQAYELHGGEPDSEERNHLNSLSLSRLHQELKALNPESAVLKNEASNRYRLIRQIEMERHKIVPRPQKSYTPDPTRSYLILGLYRPRTEIHQKIRQRLERRFRENMLQEASYLHDQCGVSWEKLESFGLEYRQMALYLQQKISFDEMQETLLCKIRQFAKRQDSWFRKMERDGFPIHWVSPSELDKAEELCRLFLNDGEIPPPTFRLSEKFYGPVTQ